MAPPDEAPENCARVPKPELATIEVVHLASEIDLSIALPDGVASDLCADAITGFTEWVGEWRGGPISVGWDWGVIAGEIIVLHPAEIRTNVRLVMDDGSLASAMLTRVHLLVWIETLPWRAAITELVRHPR